MCNFHPSKCLLKQASFSYLIAAVLYVGIQEFNLFFDCLSRKVLQNEWNHSSSKIEHQASSCEMPPWWNRQSGCNTSSFHITIFCLHLWTFSLIWIFSNYERASLNGSHLFDWDNFDGEYLVRIGISKVRPHTNDISRRWK